MASRPKGRRIYEKFMEYSNDGVPVTLTSVARVLKVKNVRTHLGNCALLTSLLFLASANSPARSFATAGGMAMFVLHQVWAIGPHVVR
jgi:hypothetical protein